MFGYPRLPRKINMKLCCVILVLVMWPNKTLQRSNPESLSYRAAVVQYSPVIDSADREDLSEVNARNYLKIIDRATSYDIDVIVFPESSLSISIAKSETIKRSQVASYVPDPTDKIIPCKDKSQHYKFSLKSISCAARDHQIYVVVNHKEKVDCTPGEGCPADGLLIYNTNVAFDRTGQVVARYRKYNLFVEHGVNVTKPIPTTFKTDFGVTFGTFICFDLTFETPALNLTRDLGVTDYLYSTHWFDASPYVFAVEAQAAWAYAYDVNFMASGFSYPKSASGGSGIYLGKQGYVKVVSENRRSNILVVAEIPKIVKGKRTQNINRDNVRVYEFTKKEISTGETVDNKKWLSMPLNLSNFSTELIDANIKEQAKTICSRGLCCGFKLTIDFDHDIIKNNSKYYRHRFAVFNGTFFVSGIGTFGITACGILACINGTIDGCGHVFDDYKNVNTPTNFTSLEISTGNITNESTFVVPTTFTQKMIPLNVTDFTFDSISLGTVSKYDMVLKRPVNNLLSFAIFGRNFMLDKLYDLNSRSNYFH